jgi:hypothetical protein
MNNEISAKIYVIETTRVSLFLWIGWQKTRGRKMKVTSIMLLKTSGDKMAETGLSIILLKTHMLQAAFHYVDEK